MRKKALGIMVLLLVAGVMLSGCATPVDPEDEYIKARDQVYWTVWGYISDHGGGHVLLPPHGVMINTSGCLVHYPDRNAGYVLDLCYLLEYGSGREKSYEGHKMFPFELPICCYGQSGQEGTNFYTSNCSNPYSGHYIWLVDENGNVCSVCVGDDCWANNESGYQGVWP